MSWGNVSKHYTNFTFMQIIVPRRERKQRDEIKSGKGENVNITKG
jgi:hypothetical protein